MEEYRRDKDILQKTFVSVKSRELPVCTLEDELKRPVDRPEVKKMVEEGGKVSRFRKFWKSRTGRDYYPFHR